MAGEVQDLQEVPEDTLPGVFGGGDWPWWDEQTCREKADSAGNAAGWAAGLSSYGTALLAAAHGRPKLAVGGAAATVLTPSYAYRLASWATSRNCKDQ